MQQKSPKHAVGLPWPAAHPSISLAVLVILGVAFIAGAATAGLANDIAEWFF